MEMLSMRKTREILRLKFDLDLSEREIADNYADYLPPSFHMKDDNIPHELMGSTPTT
jgi:hypothetical protein